MLIENEFYFTFFGFFVGLTFLSFLSFGSSIGINFSLTCIYVMYVSLFFLLHNFK